MLDWEFGNGGLIGMLGTGNAEEVHTVQDPFRPGLEQARSECGLMGRR